MLILYFLLSDKGYLSQSAIRSSICTIFSRISIISGTDAADFVSVKEAHVVDEGDGNAAGSAILILTGKSEAHKLGIGAFENKDSCDALDGINGLYVIFINGLMVVSTRGGWSGACAGGGAGADGVGAGAAVEGTCALVGAKL